MKCCATSSQLNSCILIIRCILIMSTTNRLGVDADIQMMLLLLFRW